MILFRSSIFAQGLRVALPALILWCAPSCSEKPVIEAYPIEPEYEGPVVAWKLPDTWGENPDLSGPMAGSFHVKTDDGPKGRIGVMPFRESVSTLEVANMFAREIGYGILTEQTLAPLLERKTLGDRAFEWVRMEEQGVSGSGRSILWPFSAKIPRLGSSLHCGQGTGRDRIGLFRLSRIHRPSPGQGHHPSPPPPARSLYPTRTR